MAEKKTKKVKEVKEEISHLNPDMLRDIDKFDAKRKEKELEILLAKERCNTADKELSLFSAQYTLKSKEKAELDKAVTDRTAELEELKNQSQKYFKSITQQLDLPDKWGYDPITGEIKV